MQKKAKNTSSGERGIRTLGTVTRTTVFETAPFGRSGISPNSKSAQNYDKVITVKTLLQIQKTFTKSEIIRNEEILLDQALTLYAPDNTRKSIRRRYTR